MLSGFNSVRLPFSTLVLSLCTSTRANILGVNASLLHHIRPNYVRTHLVSLSTADCATPKPYGNLTQTLSSHVRVWPTRLCYLCALAVSDVASYNVLGAVAGKFGHPTDRRNEWL